MTTLTVAPRNVFDKLPDTDVTWPLAAAGLTALVIAAALVVALVWAIRRTLRAVNQAIETQRLTGRRVLIVVAIVAAVGVAGIGGARSFTAVSDKFDSALVPLVADGMIVACTALRLAALTRGWRIPGALVTTYVFIGGTVWLNIDTATGIADAVAHALAPLAYAVLVEMLAHLLRLHMQLAQPARAKLSALTWFTSPVITARVWLHLARTGLDEPAEARALVQQVVRMASRLDSVCPSRRLWPLDAARAARTACLQTIRDGLLSAGELATLLPATGRLTPGALLALVDSAALGLTDPSTHEADPGEQAHVPAAPTTAPVWLVTYLLGALRTAPVHHSARTGHPAAVHTDTPSGAGAPVQGPHRTATTPGEAHESSKFAPGGGRSKRTDEEILAELHRLSETEHGGAPLSQQQVVAATRVGFGRAKRLVALAGWSTPAASTDSAAANGAPETRGQLQLVTEPGETPTTTSDQDDDTTTDRELETSSSR
jgi:hypothetical protein